MLSLSFEPRVLEIQRSVVIEEFKQRYLNQPYGDLWLKFRPLAFQQHSYQWPTIGKAVEHIEEATMDDVRAFFTRFYHPANATLVVGGPVSADEVFALAERWFGPPFPHLRPAWTWSNTSTGENTSTECTRWIGRSVGSNTPRTDTREWPVQREICC